MGARDLRDGRLQAAEGIDQAAVDRGIDQRPVVVLTVDLHEAAADLAHEIGADRLIVDEGARAAVGGLDRRRIRSPSSSMSLARSSARTG